jgi:hypothetical protein
MGLLQPHARYRAGAEQGRLRSTAERLRVADRGRHPMLADRSGNHTLEEAAPPADQGWVASIGRAAEGPPTALMFCRRPLRRPTGVGWFRSVGPQRALLQRSILVGGRSAGRPGVGRLFQPHRRRRSLPAGDRIRSSSLIRTSKSLAGQRLQESRPGWGLGRRNLHQAPIHENFP